MAFLSGELPMKHPVRIRFLPLLFGLALLGSSGLAWADSNNPNIIPYDCKSLKKSATFGPIPQGGNMDAVKQAPGSQYCNYTTLFGTKTPREQLIPAQELRFVYDNGTFWCYGCTLPSAQYSLKSARELVQSSCCPLLPKK